jgi:histone H3/H4
LRTLHLIATFIALHTRTVELNMGRKGKKPVKYMAPATFSSVTYGNNHVEPSQGSVHQQIPPAGDVNDNEVDQGIIPEEQPASDNDDVDEQQEAAEEEEADAEEQQEADEEPDEAYSEDADADEQQEVEEPDADEQQEADEEPDAEEQQEVDEEPDAEEQQEVDEEPDAEEQQEAEEPDEEHDGEPADAEEQQGPDAEEQPPPTFVERSASLSAEDLRREKFDQQQEPIVKLLTKKRPFNALVKKIVEKVAQKERIDVPPKLESDAYQTLRESAADFIGEFYADVCAATKHRKRTRPNWQDFQLVKDSMRKRGRL